MPWPPPACWPRTWCWPVRPSCSRSGRCWPCSSARDRLRGAQPHEPGDDLVVGGGRCPARTPGARSRAHRRQRRHRRRTGCRGAGPLDAVPGADPLRGAARHGPVARVRVRGAPHRGAGAQPLAGRPRPGGLHTGRPRRPGARPPPMRCAGCSPRRPCWCGCPTASATPPPRTSRANSSPRRRLRLMRSAGSAAGRAAAPLCPPRRCPRAGSTASGIRLDIGDPDDDTEPGWLLLGGTTPEVPMARLLPWLAREWRLGPEDGSVLAALAAALGSALRAGQTLRALTEETTKLGAVVAHASDGIALLAPPVAVHHVESGDGPDHRASTERQALVLPDLPEHLRLVPAGHRGRAGRAAPDPQHGRAAPRRRGGARASTWRSSGSTTSPRAASPPS